MKALHQDKSRQPSRQAGSLCQHRDFHAILSIYKLSQALNDKNIKQWECTELNILLFSQSSGNTIVQIFK